MPVLTHPDVAPREAVTSGVSEANPDPSERIPISIKGDLPLIYEVCGAIVSAIYPIAKRGGGLRFILKSENKG